MSRNVIGLAILLAMAVSAFISSRGGLFGREDPRSAKALAE